MKIRNIVILSADEYDDIMLVKQQEFEAYIDRLNAWWEQKLAENDLRHTVLRARDLYGMEHITHAEHEAYIRAVVTENERAAGKRELPKLATGELLPVTNGIIVGSPDSGPETVVDLGAVNRGIRTALDAYQGDDHSDYPWVLDENGNEIPEGENPPSEAL